MILAIVAFRSKLQTDLQLRASEETHDALQAMIDTGKFGYAILNESGCVVEWNKAIAEETGHDKAEVLAKGLRCVMEPEVYARHEAAFDAAMRRAAEPGENPELEKVNRVICNVPAADGTLLPVEVTFRIVRTRHNTLFAIAHIDRQDQIIEQGKPQ